MGKYILVSQEASLVNEGRFNELFFNVFTCRHVCEMPAPLWGHGRHEFFYAR